MRLIGMFLVLFFTVRLQPAFGYLDVQTSCTHACISSPVFAGSVWVSTPASEGDGAVWASGLELPGRYRQRRNPIT